MSALQCRLWAFMSALALLLGACAQPPTAPTSLLPSRLPALRLAPAQSGQAFNLAQRLTVSRLDRPEAAPQGVDVQLELDREHLRLAGFALGQRVLLMDWDGESLLVQRHPRLPAEVDADRMLRDMILLYWPVDAIRAVLPTPWTVEERGQERRLLEAGEVRLRMSWEGVLEGSSRVEIVNAVERYRLRIDSQSEGGAP